MTFVDVIADLCLENVSILPKNVKSFQLSTVFLFVCELFRELEAPDDFSSNVILLMKEKLFFFHVEHYLKMTQRSRKSKILRKFEFF